MKGIFTLMFQLYLTFAQKIEKCFCIDYGEWHCYRNFLCYYEEGCTLHCDFFPSIRKNKWKRFINKTANQAHPYDGLINGHLARFLKCNQNPLTLLKDYTLKSKASVAVPMHRL